MSNDIAQAAVGAARDLVVASETEEFASAVTVEDGVVTIAASHEVVAIATIEEIISLEPDQRVIAVKTVEFVREIGAGEHVVTGRASFRDHECRPYLPVSC